VPETGTDCVEQASWNKTEREGALPETGCDVQGCAERVAGKVTVTTADLRSEVEMLLCKRHHALVAVAVDRVLSPWDHHSG